MALTEALHHAIEIELDREQRPAHHFVNFTITAQGFTHAYQTAHFTVGEFLQRTARLDEMSATLAGKLNSNEAFNLDRGFQVDVVFVSMPGPGSDYRKKKTQSWSSVSGSRKQEKTMYRHHQKQRCLMLCSRHGHHACTLPQRSRHGWVSPMGQFKAWASGATKTSPRLTSASGGNRGSLWLARASPISTGVGISIPTLDDDPDETVLSDFQRTRCPPSDSFTEIQ